MFWNSDRVSPFADLWFKSNEADVMQELLTRKNNRSYQCYLTTHTLYQRHPITY